MDLLRSVVLFILLIDTNVADFIISGNRTNWPAASGLCTLAGPDLIFASNEITVDIAEKINDDVWIGYYKARTAFEYFGCAVKDGTKTPLDTDIKGNPGNCFSACGTQGIVGIFQNECFCFKEHEIKLDASTMLSYCNQKCTDEKGKGTGIVCGGSTDTGGGTYISLYRSIRMNISVDDGDSEHFCMAYLNRFQWHRCSEYNKFICETVRSTPDVDHESVRISDDYEEWAVSTTQCFTTNSRPSTYNTTKNVHISVTSSPLWTGIVRSDVIYKSAKDSSHVNHAIGYGYIKRNSNEVKFTANRSKKRICVNGTSGTKMTSFPVSTVPSTTNDETGSPTTEPANTKHSSESPTTTVKGNDTNSTSEFKSEGSPVVGAAVGATLAIVAAIVIGIIIVIFLRKRGVKLPFLEKEKPTKSTNISKNNAGIAISRPVEIQRSTYNTSQSDYADIDLKTTIDNEGTDSVVNDTLEKAHGYLVLEKLEEEQYDTTKPENKKSHQNTSNPYNTLSLEEGSDYDHVENGNVSGSECTSLGNSNLKTSRGAQSNVYNTVDDTEDTYNHTNVSSKNGLRISENDYDAI